MSTSAGRCSGHQANQITMFYNMMLLLSVLVHLSVELLEVPVTLTFQIARKSKIIRLPEKIKISFP